MRVCNTKRGYSSSTHISSSLPVSSLSAAQQLSAGMFRPYLTSPDCGKSMSPSHVGGGRCKALSVLSSSPTKSTLHVAKICVCSSRSLLRSNRTAFHMSQSMRTAISSLSPCQYRTRVVERSRKLYTIVLNRLSSQIKYLWLVMLVITVFIRCILSCMSLGSLSLAVIVYLR